MLACVPTINLLYDWSYGSILETIGTFGKNKIALSRNLVTATQNFEKGFEHTASHLFILNAFPTEFDFYLII